MKKQCIPLAFLVAASISILVPTSAQARPAHKRALADFFGPFLPKKLNDCQTCHVADNSKDAGNTLETKDKPHNAFGARLKAVKKELSKAGKSTDIASRLEAICEEDSDGDGISNVIEILTGHFPGDAADVPSSEEVAASRKLLIDFQKFKSGYPWRPLEIVKRPTLPKVNNPAWVRNPIDVFVAAEHDQRGLKPRPEAPKEVLLRRIYLDLIGLPPTIDELHAFLDDSSSNAYEKVVDRLLASPQYGERWGRHWMDIWRYSDWAGWGQEVRDSQPHVWKWRDWIVESLNQDKGYDRMILEMIAGDEMAPEDERTVRATGYLVRNYKRYGREKWLQDTVDHVFQAFQGTTIGCARCHDHMYDPIVQKDYYRVRAIFEPYSVRIDRVPGQPDVNKDGLARVYDATPDAKTFLFIRGDERTPEKDALEPGVPEALGGHFLPCQPVKLPVAVTVPGKRAFVEKEDLAASIDAVSKARETLNANRLAAAREIAESIIGRPLHLALRFAATQKSINDLELAEVAAHLAEARLTAFEATLGAEHLEDAGRKDSEEGKAAAFGALAAQRAVAYWDAKLSLLASKQALSTTPMAKRGEATKKVNEAQAALAKAEADLKLPLSTAYVHRSIATFPTTSTGRRLAFAKWLADRNNPLTARVAMNHIWLRHFGQAIVPSVFDFGRNGRQPSHPALLDWLAAEFMEQTWSIKAMHRLIVTSNTYRMASTSDEASAALDRDNKFLWRMPPHRIEAEAVRDCVFYVAGKLDLTVGGPDIDQQLGLTVPRRSIYFRHAAEKQMEFLKIFDSADVYECYRRKTSVMPQQALALVNSELTLRHARLLARFLAASKEGSDPGQFTTTVFDRILSRKPTSEELADCVAFLQERTASYSKESSHPPTSDPECKQPAVVPHMRARENLVHVLLNHHDFVTVK
jgi:hypothetical protein